MATIVSHEEAKPMKINQRSPLPGLLSYGIGAAVGLFLMLVAVWADMESGSYGFARLADAGLGGLHCPVLMTPAETSTITLNVSNPTSNRISPSIRIQISTPLLPEEILENIQLTPGESKRLEWSVDAENIDLGYFIFAKVLLYSAYPLPSREATCGIFVIDLPGTGQILMPVLMGLSLLCLVWGMRSINRFSASNERLRKHKSLLTFLSIMIGLGLALNLVDAWIASLLVLVVSLLLIIVLLSSLFMDNPHRN
jgi:hypothetical protein